MPKISPKTRFFDFCQKLIHSCFFFTQKWFLKEFLVILQKAHVRKKIWFENAVFFDHQYLWKESSGILVIFHGIGLQAKAASEKAVV